MFLRCCTAYQDLLEQLDAGDAVTMQPRLEIAVLGPDGRRGWLRRSSLPAPLHLAGAVLRYPFLTARERIGVAWAMRRLAKVNPDDPAADARSFGAWLREHRQSPDALETVWGLITRPTAAGVARGKSIGRISADALLPWGPIKLARPPRNAALRPDPSSSIACTP